MHEEEEHGTGDKTETEESLVDADNEEHHRETSPVSDQSEEDLADADEELKHNSAPTDSGWAWMVLLGAVLEMTLFIGIMKSAGIMFVAFQQRFRSSSSMTSLLSTVQNAVYSISALLVMTIGVKITSGRKLVFLGSTLISIAYIITSQAEDIRVLLFSHGILQGFGSACMQPIVISTLGQYFDKKRGFANSIAVSGGSLGGLIFAPLLTVLFETYGYQGCVLIVAALLLNMCVTGALFRSRSFYTKKRSKGHRKEMTNRHASQAQHLISKSNDDTMNTSTDEKKISDRVIARMFFSRQNSKQHNGEILQEVFNTKTNGEKGELPLVPNSPCPRRRHRTTTESSVSRIFDTLSNSKYDSSEYIAGSMMDLPGIIGTNCEDESDEDDYKNTTTTTSNKILNMLKSFLKLFDIKLFKNPVFLTLQTSFFLLCSGNALCSVFVAPYAIEVGVSPTGVASIITIFSATDLCSRIVIAFIADRGWIRRSNLIGLAAMIISLTAHLLRFYTNFGLLVFYGVVLGLFSGIYFSLFAVVIVDYMTVAKLQNTLGFTTLFHGSGVAISFFVIGYLRDVNGSYIIPFHLLGTMNFIGGVLMFLLPMVEKSSKNNQEAVKQKELTVDA